MTGPGLADERTALAWRRTALGLLSYAALVAHAGLVNSSPTLVGSSLLPAAGAAALYAVGRTRQDARGALPVAASRLLVAAYGVAAAVAILAAVLASGGGG